VKDAVFWQEVGRCQSATHCSGRASKGARQAAWADVADVTAVEEDAGLVAAVAGGVAAAVGVVEAAYGSEAAVGEPAEMEACCATWRRLYMCGRGGRSCGRGRCAARECSSCRNYQQSMPRKRRLNW
jgi:hypothetical protein